METERRAGWSEYEAGQMQAKLSAAISQLAAITGRLDAHTARMDEQTERISMIEDRFRFGKIGLIALIIGIGIALVGVRDMIETFFRRIL